ncbi:hypothetical protein AWN73_01910 [Clostridium butyricum]|uniref:KAP NTPase domain-containing protein n=2 Tax=Clostridium butyricum TaxID=1492 RepID=A0A2S7FCL4_CLOBU|nr:P-loop NTPase fold protein [Clostridium butyricum]PPV15867.1 hypothetical protein AWN73_01910 [Clostridium butyricum]
MDKMLSTFNEDLLNRKQIAVNLTNIINSKNNLKVLAIDSGWGTGKTTFATMWRNMINSDETYSSELEIMYFNAWENDYISEPLTSILSELENQIKDKNIEVKSIFERGKEKIKPYAKAGGEILLKHITKGVLDNIDWQKDLEDGLIELSNKVGQIAFKEISIYKNCRKVLKEDLEIFQKKINKKVIIFVDELDRCKPTYAVNVLETIKHIFNLENFIFVIFLDKQQLSFAIKTLYGEGMDSDGYLRRFFDLEYQLPNDSTTLYLHNKNDEIEKNFNNTVYLTRLLEEIFISEEYSLRDINKAYDYIELLLPNIKYYRKDDCEYQDSYLLVESYLYAFFINLKIKHSNMYRDIKNRSYDSTDEYITKNIITFDIESFNLEVGKYVDETAKETLNKVIPLYLQLLKKNKEYYLYGGEEEKYCVGLRDDNGRFDSESK